MPRATNLKLKNLAITFPQNDTDKEVVLQRIKELYKSKLKHAIVGAELHKDGGKHLHCLIMLNTDNHRHYFRDLDKLAGKRGDYKPTRSCKSWAKYCIKDGDFTTFPHNWDAKGYAATKDKKTSAKSVLVATAILEGTSNAELARHPEYRGYFLEKKQKIEQYRSFIQELETHQDKYPFFIPVTDPLENVNDSIIAAWLAKNIRKPRPLRQRQLWIFGKTEMGKTSLLINLAKMLKVFHFPIYTFPFVEGFNNQFELIVFEEFSGGVPINFLNQFVDGSPIGINKKGSYVMKRKNIPVIVLSNLSIEEVYEKAGNKRPAVLEALKSRFREIYVDKPIDLYYKHDFEVIPDEEEAPVDPTMETNQQDSSSSESESSEDSDETPRRPAITTPFNPLTISSNQIDLQFLDDSSESIDYSAPPIKRTHAIAFKSTPRHSDTNTFHTAINQAAKDKEDLQNKRRKNK